MKQLHHLEKITTQEGISIIDLNHDINSAIIHSGISDGFVIVSSRHTTTAIRSIYIMILLYVIARRMNLKTHIRI